MQIRKAPEPFERVDKRGRFVEIIAEGTWRSIIHGSMRAGAVMGNHYHRDTVVYYFLTSGRVDIDLVQVDSYERSRITLNAGEGIYLEQGISHAIRFRQNSSFILLKSRAYDPKNPDTYEFEIEDIDAPVGTISESGVISSE